jgi:hypothetical protein
VNLLARACDCRDSSWLLPTRQVVTGGQASPCGRATAHRRHARARFVLAGRALLVPEASVRSGHQRTTASVTAPLSCITSPRWATRGYFPSPRCPPSWVAPGPPPPALSPTTRARRRSGQSRRRLIARVGVTDSVGQGVPSACPRRGPVIAPCLAPLPLGSGAPAARGSCCPPRRAVNGGEAGRNAAGRIIAFSG